MVLPHCAKSGTLRSPGIKKLPQVRSDISERAIRKKAEDIAKYQDDESSFAGWAYNTGAPIFRRF